MRTRPKTLAAVALAVLGIAVAGCGSSSSPSTNSSSSTSTPATTASTTTAGSQSCGSSSTAPPATSEAQSTAQGDIPDNQQFLHFRNTAAGYTIDYPEGWAQSGNGDNVTFQQQGNSITVQVKAGSQPTAASVKAELDQLAASNPCLKPGTPQAVTAGHNQAIKVTYETVGQKSSVTGQRPKITVDRYVYFKNGNVATVDLATPVGVDNVDAFRMISESFTWS